MKPTLEQIEANITLINTKLDDKSADELGNVWVMAKSLSEKYRKNSPEQKALLPFMANIHKLMRSKSKDEMAAILSPAEQERLNNKKDDNENNTISV